MQQYKLIAIILWTVISTVSSYGQELKEIEINSQVLKKVAKEFIVNTKKENKRFNDYGYVEITLVFYDAKAISNKKISYIIKDQYYNLGNLHSSSKKIPDYYTYIEGKITFIFIDDLLNEFWKKPINVKKEKRKISKLLKPFLSKSEHLIVRDKKGKKVIDDRNFRPDESYNIHGGITLNIYANDEYEIIKNQ